MGIEELVHGKVPTPYRGMIIYTESQVDDLSEKGIIIPVNAYYIKKGIVLAVASDVPEIEPNDIIYIPRDVAMDFGDNKIIPAGNVYAWDRPEFPV
jgi:hypothetical protein